MIIFIRPQNNKPKVVCKCGAVMVWVERIKDPFQPVLYDVYLCLNCGNSKTVEVF